MKCNRVGDCPEFKSTLSVFFGANDGSSRLQYDIISSRCAFSCRRCFGGGVLQRNSEAAGSSLVTFKSLDFTSLSVALCAAAMVGDATGWAMREAGRYATIVDILSELETHRGVLRT